MPSFPQLRHRVEEQHGGRGNPSFGGLVCAAENINKHSNILEHGENAQSFSSFVCVERDCVVIIWLGSKSKMQNFQKFPCEAERQGIFSAVEWGCASGGACWTKPCSEHRPSTFPPCSRFFSATFHIEQPTVLVVGVPRPKNRNPRRLLTKERRRKITTPGHFRACGRSDPYQR